jgi:glycerol kinase
MAGPLLVAIDQGTSSTKCLVVDDTGRVVARGQAPLGQATPQPGWVEQDADEIIASVRRAVAEAVTPDLAGRIVSVGLSNQRESCVIWDRASGEAVTPVLSWQDQRTIGICEAIASAGHGATVRARSGLPLDPMFSAAKATWLLDRIDPDRVRASAGKLVVGTIDSFLVSRFGGEPVVEAGNASRTQLMDVFAGCWDDDLLDLFGVPAAALPRIVPSTGPFPAVRGLDPITDGTPLGAVLADSHAALFAHGAFEPGPTKATQGTGSSVMGLLDLGQGGAERLHPGVCVTVAWSMGTPVLAFEGNIRSAGSTLVWLADLLGIDSAELARLASTVPNSAGVHLVPGFNGLGAPWWDGNAVAVLSGFSLGAGRPVICRAALESIGHQIADVVDAVRSSGVPVNVLHVDGGPTRNDQLLQFEADMVGVPVVRTDTAELSAMGAAHLAGVSSGVFTLDGLRRLDRGGTRFEPMLADGARAASRAAWIRAVARARSDGAS